MCKTYCLYVVCWTVLSLFSLYPAVGEARNGVTSFPEKPFVSDSILEYIFHSARFYSEEVRSYKGDLYLKGMLQVHKQNRIIKYVPSMFRFEKGVKN